MRNVVLYIAISLDGYIADKNGGVDWIKGQDESAPLEDTFTPFFSDVDTVVMGRRTYNQIITSLSPDNWPYKGATSFVLTHDKNICETDNIRFRDINVCQLVSELRKGNGKNIWICGGAEIVGQLIAQNLIDIYHLAVVPVILGGGTRLFETISPKIELRLIQTVKYNGITELIYDRCDNDTIRRMTEADIDNVMRIWLTSNIKAHDFIPASYWEGQYDKVKLLLAEAEIYVCEKFGQVIGFIGLLENYIAGIFVDSEFQSKGIGKKLMDYVKALKSDLQLHVYEKNCRAVKFYQRENFDISLESIDEDTGEKEYMMKFVKPGIN